MAKRYGLITTEEGVDIENAPDFKKTFDSDWPMIQIAYQAPVSQNVDVPLLGGFGGPYQTRIYDHKLGFAPAFIWIDSLGNDPYGTGHVAGSTFYNYNVYSTPDGIFVRTDFISASDTPLSFPITGQLIVFDYDPTKSFKSASATSNENATKSNIGIKILKDPISSMSDTELSKYSLNTKAKSLMVHQSGVATTDDTGQLTIEHDLGYFPSYLIFQIPDATNQSSFTQHVPARSYGDLNKLNFFGVQSVLAGNFPYIIFKDPIGETA